eukprot:TRINITY_DN538_c1_g1_i1.p1 TRINITY_DN538_c1_g1~~TRINITY_DN538_c1_g1_i1.p1  ORF type:complete len:1196 (+),score=313.45 TRINITY_DN538_c1_g1_i1:116-3703(+)
MSSSVGLTDHYGGLEVERDADEATIKKAYRRLVLQWHPDKHGANREAAEEKIRLINDAYETLSNPFKRSQYDAQLLALERKARGIRLDTTSIKPRMSIPKEFMLAPMGHPEKFVRTVGTSVFGQSRKDQKAEFYDFFREAKFSLWWLPEVNNMCRLRPTTTAGVGQDGGMNFNFALSRQVHESEVTLSPGTWPESANVIAVASPVFPRAFRFEAAHFPGHYLAYRPPTHVRMVGGVVDETTAIDFVLVDYKEMYNYITMEEVLRPVMVEMKGDKDFVKLDKLREHKDLVAYFTKVLKKSTWSDDDFETFFASRSGEWDYDPGRFRVRMRSKHEQLSNSLRRSKNLPEIAAAVSSAADYDVLHLPLDTLEHLLDSFMNVQPTSNDLTTAIHMLDAQKKVLVAIPKAVEKEASFRRLLSIYGRVIALGGENPDASIAKWRGETANDLGELAAEQIKKRSLRDDMTRSVLISLFDMPLDWRICAEKMAKHADSLLEDEPLRVLLPLLRKMVKQLPSSQPVAARLASLARQTLPQASASEAAEALDVMVSGGLCLEYAPLLACGVMKSAPFEFTASILAGLSEKGASESGGSDMKDLAKYVGRSQAALEAVSPASLLRLTVASTKSAYVAEYALDAVALAAAMTLPGWSLDDATKLLLALAKAKVERVGDGVKHLYSRASDVLSPRLSELSGVQLIKVVLALGKAPGCRDLLEAAVTELARNRLRETPQSQALLLTQSVLGSLGADHASMQDILDFWASSFSEATRVENLLGPETALKRREEMEAKGQLSADQLAKLATMLAEGASGHTSFWRAFGRRMVGTEEAEGLAFTLSATGRQSMEAIWAGGGGPELDDRIGFLRAVRGEKPKDREKEKEKERERDKEQRRGDGDRETRDRDRDRDRGRDRGGRGDTKNNDTKDTRSDSRGKRKKDREKDRGKDKEKAKEKEREPDEKRLKKDKEERGTENKAPLPSSLLVAAESGTLDQCKSLLKASANLDEANASGARALHLAARRGSKELCVALLAARAEVNAADAEGCTALHCAAGLGSVEVCEALVDGSADVNAQQGDGSTPLHLATAAGFAGVIAILVQSKASATIKDNKGNTPMDMWKVAEERQREFEQRRKEVEEAEQEKRRQQRERRDKLKEDEKQKKAAEDEKRRQQRERRQNKRKQEVAAVVDDDSDEDVGIVVEAATMVLDD